MQPLEYDVRRALVSPGNYHVTQMLPSSPQDRTIHISKAMESATAHLCTVLHVALLLSVHFNINEFAPLDLTEVTIATCSLAPSCTGSVPPPRDPNE